MKNANIKKRINRIRRHIRVRAKISGTAERPRIAVFKSNRYTYLQAIDDLRQSTIASVRDSMLSAKSKKSKSTKTERAAIAATELAKALSTKKIKSAVFDKSGFKYHGRIKAAAEALREAGITI